MIAPLSMVIFVSGGGSVVMIVGTGKRREGVGMYMAQTGMRDKLLENCWRRYWNGAVVVDKELRYYAPERPYILRTTGPPPQSYSRTAPRGIFFDNLNSSNLLFLWIVNRRFSNGNRKTNRLPPNI